MEKKGAKAREKVEESEATIYNPIGFFSTRKE